VHAAPASLEVAVRDDEDERVVASGQVRRGEEGPMSTLVRRGSEIRGGPCAGAAGCTRPHPLPAQDLAAAPAAVTSATVWSTTALRSASNAGLVRAERFSG
jgi:hypothetical protein